MSLLALVELIISSNDYAFDESYFTAGGQGRDKVGMDYQHTQHHVYILEVDSFSWWMP